MCVRALLPSNVRPDQMPDQFGSLKLRSNTAVRTYFNGDDAVETSVDYMSLL